MIKQCLDRMEPYFDSFMDFVRIYLGVGLLIKGVFYLMNPGQLAGLMEGTALASFVGVVPYVHIIGGLMLALGIFTRLAAIAQIPILFGAVFLVNLQRTATMQTREGLEFSALVLFLMVLIAIKGASNFALMKPKAGSAMSTNAYQRWVNGHPDVFIDLIRAYLGIGLFFKGIYLMQHSDQLSKLMQDTGGQNLLTIAAAHYILPVHFAGGLLLAIGLLTRWAAGAQLPLLLGAVFYIYVPNISRLELRENLEFSALVLFLLALVTMHGSGRFSVDYTLEKNRQTVEPHPVHL